MSLNERRRFVGSAVGKGAPSASRRWRTAHAPSLTDQLLMMRARCLTVTRTASARGALSSLDAAQSMMVGARVGWPTSLGPDLVALGTCLVRTADNG